MSRVQQWLKEYAEPPGKSGAPLSRSLTRVHDETGIDFTRARARAGFARGHLLEISLQLPGGVGSDREQDAAESLLRLLLGDLAFERWVGSLAVVPAPRGGSLVVVSDASAQPESIGLNELVLAIEAAQRGLYEGLPGVPHARAREAADWLMFELEPEPARDYAAQDDLAIATTTVPELKKCFLRAQPFFSGRFSKHREVFGYLKYEGEEQDAEARLSERSRLEAALETALRPTLGALVGAGFGLRYGYLDLALCDARRALDVLPGVLRTAGVAKRSWLLFCDSELAREYVPIWPKVEPPFFG
ncbi:MAG TPA: hypothetical protein VGI10_04505 [Polyangiaceae bacterium]|jgi:hypothetical protein